MSDVIFEEDTLNTATRPESTERKESFILRLVYKTGLAKTPEEANVVLIGVCISCVVLSGILLFVGKVF